MEKFLCTLEVKECEHKGDNNACLIDKPGCSFRMQEVGDPKDINDQPFQKKKKWFEVYVK